MAQSRRVTRSAHAKINLALAVGPPRPSDGLHPICSWFAPIDLCDEVTVEVLPDGTPSRCEIGWASDAPSASVIDWPIEKDLAARAHRAVESLAGRALPAIVTVRKRIPVGGGLGGGSSDAAATMLALRDAFGLTLDPVRAAEAALRLGSDVPFFLREAMTPALVEGVGELVLGAPSCAGLSVALVFPPFGTPTGAVYRAFDALAASEFRAERVRRMALGGRGVRSDELFNDLAIPAERAEPRLAELRRAAERVLGAPLHITGSGSTMFALFSDHEAARAGAAALGAGLPGCRALAARLL